MKSIYWPYRRRARIPCSNSPRVSGGFKLVVSLSTPSPCPEQPACVSHVLPGLLLAGAIAALALLAARSPAQHAGFSALTLAIIGGILAGNTFFPGDRSPMRSGSRPVQEFAAACRHHPLRLSNHLSANRRGRLDRHCHRGPDGDALTHLIAVQIIGTRVCWTGLPDFDAALIGAGSAICGAAAVIAVEPVVGGQAHKVCVAVATVVIFGTLSMSARPTALPAPRTLGTAVRHLRRFNHS